MAKTQALIVEDDPLFQTRLRNAVAQLGADWSCTIAASAKSARLAITAASSPYGLAIIDLVLPDESGLAVVSALRELSPPTSILMVSSLSSERTVLDAIRLGAAGFLNKDEPIEEIAWAIGEVLRGNNPISPSLARHIFRVVAEQPAQSVVDPSPLTPRHREILSLLASGYSYADAAQSLGISLSTFQTHIRHIYKALEVRTGAQAVSKALGRGWI